MNGMVKIIVEYDNGKTENMWATPLTQNNFKIENSPFFYRGFSYHDVIEGEIRDGNIFFKKVIERSGHSTYRILLARNSTKNDFIRYWEPIEKLGCTYEYAKGSLYAVDIAPEVNIHKAYSLLEKGEQEGVWTFEEGHCGHPSIVKDK